MQIVSGDITRDITGEIVYLKAYKQMVGEVTGYSTEKGTGSTQPHRAFNSEVHILGTRYSIRIKMRMITDMIERRMDGVILV